MSLANSDWAANARNAFSTNFQKVIHPVQLAQTLAHYLRRKAPENHKHCWGFNGLQWHHVGDISKVCACAAHTFATLLSKFANFSTVAANMNLRADIHTGLQQGDMDYVLTGKVMNRLL